MWGTGVTAGFPFSAVVGHDEMRLALLLNAVHPAIGGVLVRGEKGTAKSTVVRALAGLLPDVDVVDGCRFACDPAAPDPNCPDAPHPVEALTRPAHLVELPVGATEDRVIGSLDLERALTSGVRAYQPGLLAGAHRGVLYVDEVNLLHDHLVDLLLDAAAMGRAHVERDGVSVSHAATFLLVGTMNPEEGELRPQLLDRFGLTVRVVAARDVGLRAEVIRRRLAYEADPAGFAAGWAAADRELADRIARARVALASVVLPDIEVRRIAAVCAAMEVDGMRADLVVARTAIAHAAWRDATEVTEADVEIAVRLALPHRRRRDPFDEPELSEEQLSDALRSAADEVDQPEPPEPPDGPDGPDGDSRPDDAAEAESNGSEPAQARAPQHQPPATPSPSFRARLLQVPGVGEGAPGRRSRSRAGFGRAVRATSGPDGAGLHLVGTLSAAAPHQRDRGRTGPGLRLRPGDVRLAVREGREGNLVLFAVDASGSMAARARMSAVTGAVLSLLADAYQRRDKVGVVTFRATGAEVALPPTSSVDAAARRLRGLSTGGRTPIADGLLLTRKVLAAERLRDPRRRPLLIVLTDGKATASGAGGDPVADALRAAALLARDGVASVTVDCENGPVRLGLAARLAGVLGGPCLTLAQLSADQVAGVVRAA
jgi:magnesium chelatase subunit D